MSCIKANPFMQASIKKVLLMLGLAFAAPVMGIEVRNG
jgi:hypothetical protein